MKLIVSQCRSLNDVCSFKLIKPMMWDSPPLHSPSLKIKTNPNDQSAQQTPSSGLVISITYPSSATCELARVSPLLHTAAHELNGGCVRFISPTAYVFEWGTTGALSSISISLSPHLHTCIMHDKMASP